MVIAPFQFLSSIFFFSDNSQKTLWSTQEGFLAKIHIQTRFNRCIHDFFTIVPSRMRYLIRWNEKKNGKIEPSIDWRKYRCKKVPAYLSPPLRRIFSSSMRACGWRRDLFKNPFSFSSSSSSSASGNERMEKGSLLQEAEGHTSFWVASRKRAPTRGGAVCFFFISLGEI